MGGFGRKSKASDNDSLLAARIAKTVLAFQRRLADQLNTKVRRMKPGTLSLLFLGFGIVFGAYCLWLVLGLFR